MSTSVSTNAVTIDVGVDLPSQILRSIHQAVLRSIEAPLSLEIVNSSDNTRELSLSEPRILQSVVDALENGSACMHEFTIYTELRSSLPHPVVLLYGRVGRHLRRLVLQYNIDDEEDALHWTLPPPPTSLIRGMYPNLEELYICGTVLLDLLSYDRSYNLTIPLANLRTLDIVAFRGCLKQVSGDHYQLLFDLLQSLTKLRSFRMEEFDIPASLQQDFPGLVATFPGIAVKNVTIVRTNGDSLSFLLRRLVPDELLLDGCCFGNYLPHCTLLFLHNIPFSTGVTDALCAWDGESLEILSSPLFNDDFLTRLQALSQARRKPLWPHLQYVNVQECGFTYSKWMQVLETRSHRLGFLPTQSSCLPERYRDVSRWASELTNVSKRCF